MIYTSEIVVWPLASSQSAPDKGGAPALPFFDLFGDPEDGAFMRRRLSCEGRSVSIPHLTSFTTFRRPLRRSLELFTRSFRQDVSLLTR
jgi:hypothetical protein